MQKTMTKIHVVAMDDRSCEMLRLFFQNFCDNCCEMSEEPDAQVILINMDHANANNELSRLKKNYPGVPLILTSIKPVETNDYYFLRKPMIAAHLIAIIDKVNGTPSVKAKTQQPNKIVVQKEKVKNPEIKPSVVTTTELQLNEKDVVAFVGEADDVDLRNPVNLGGIFFDMDECFLRYLKQAYQQAKKGKCAVRITGLWKPIIVFSESNQIYIEMSDQQLKSICAVSLDSSAITKVDIKLEPLISRKAALYCEKNKNYQRLDSFMWKISLWTSRGRLPQGMPLDSALYLLGWPNLTRLILTPEVLRITACWVRHPRTIINLTEVIGGPQRYLFSFITASYVLGMAGLANRESDNLILPPDTGLLIKMNLFSRTMKKFKGR